jgi:hypothetical protein
MLLEYSHISTPSLLFFLCVCYGYFVVLIHSITVAHQLQINISPPIPSKQDKTLWIGGIHIYIFKHMYNFALFL